jgi:hypothetical protein
MLRRNIFAASSVPSALLRRAAAGASLATASFVPSVASAARHHHSACSSSGAFRPTRRLLDDNNSSAAGGADQTAQQQQQQPPPKFSVPSWTDPNSPNLYTRLGLRKDATTEDIKKHYRGLSRIYHPDVNKDPTAEAKFLSIKEAYETLSDTQKRNVYDSTGASWSQQEQYQRAAGAGGANPFYSASWSYSNRAVNPQLTRGLMFIVFFSFGLLISAIVELRARRNQQATAMSDSQKELNATRSSLWRPFFGIILFVSVLPRLPAAILTWYFYAYLPTIRAEDRASRDPTIVVRDELQGKGFHVNVASPFLEQLSRGATSSGGRGQDHIFVVAVQPDDSRLTVQQQNEVRDALAVLNAQQQQTAMGQVEYIAPSVNRWEMSVPKPHLFVKSLGGMVPVPTRVTLKVKTVVKDSKTGKIMPERGEVVFERVVDI